MLMTSQKARTLLDEILSFKYARNHSSRTKIENLAEDWNIHDSVLKLEGHPKLKDLQNEPFR